MSSFLQKFKVLKYHVLVIQFLAIVFKRDLQLLRNKVEIIRSINFYYLIPPKIWNTYSMHDLV